VETALNFLQDISLITFKTYTREHIDSEEVWGEEGEVIIISLT
jgi:hypothetical protein